MRAPALLLAALALALPLPAQDVFGEIGGTIKDPGGAVIASASVRLVHADTGQAYATKTNSQGEYTFPNLPIGIYAISAEHPGFKRELRKGIELHISDHLRVDLALTVGDVTQEVSVVADAPQVQTETSEQSGLISGEQVRDLQLNGRSFMTLLELMPGVTSNMPDRVDPNTTPQLQINGARSSSANFNIDGGNNSDVIVGSGSLNTFTSIEQIAEFKVITSTFAAEYGRGGFSQVNVVTRGGGRDIHGSAYEFVRNDAFDARDFFTHQVLPLKLNNFGYTVSGPVVIPKLYNRDRRKTFFFVNQEFNRLTVQPVAVNTTVPTAANRRGDFSSAAVAIVDPLTGSPFPDRLVPASRIDPNAARLIGLYPLPNFTGPGAINFTSAAPSRQNFREDMIRIDQVIGPAWKLYGRYSQDGADITDPYGGTSTGAIGTRFPGISATDATRPGKNATLNMTSVLSQGLLNELSVNYSARIITQTAVNHAADRAGLGIDIPEIFQHPAIEGNIIPGISLNSNYAALGVSRNYLKRLFNTEYSDNLTRIAGRHVFKFGGIYQHGGNRENNSSPNTNGAYSFATNFTRDPVANLLLGLPNSYTETQNSVITHIRFSSFEAFAQDDFKVASRLTLNYGIRYTAYFNPYDTNNVLTNFIPSLFHPATAEKINPATSSGRIVPGSGDPLDGLAIGGRNSPYGRGATNNNVNLFGPRFGFAWDPFGDKKTAVRGGYGMYYTRPLIGTYINAAYSNPPFANTVTILTPSFSNPGAGSLDPTAPALTTLGNPMPAPTVQQWSMGVQREIFWHTVLNVAYVGSHGTHLMRPLNINDPPPGLAALEKVHVNAVRPYQGYGAITERQDSATSTYHSLQVSFNRRLARKLSLTGSYTFSKSIDNSSSERGGSDVPPNSSNAAAERAISDFNRKHVLTASYIYSLPNFVRHPAAGLFVNGWQLSGITRFYSGNSFDVQMTTDVAGIGETQNQRPNVLSNPNRGPHTTGEWFDIYAFARPATGTFGNLGRNTIRGPGVNKWDLALFKNFMTREGRHSTQFRAEAFNVFNHPSFDNPAVAVTTTGTGLTPAANSFGVITGTRDARVLQVAVKFTY